MAFSLCQRNYEQVRLVHLTGIVVLVPQIKEQIVNVIKVISEWMSKRIVQQIVDVPRATDRGCATAADHGGNCGAGSRSWTAGVVSASPFFLLACGTAHSHTRELILNASDGWNLEHVVLDLFSHI